jgi:hypothetical protein
MKNTQHIWGTDKVSMEKIQKIMDYADFLIEKKSAPEKVLRDKCTGSHLWIEDDYFEPKVYTGATRNINVFL